MKTKYEELKMELTLFTMQDVITASQFSGGFEGEEDDDLNFEGAE